MQSVQRRSVEELPEVIPATRPASCTNGWINGVGLLAFLVVGWLAYGADMAEETRAVLWLLAAAGPIILLDLTVRKVYRRPSTGLRWGQIGQLDLSRVYFKLVGVAATYGLIALAYWAFPEYHGDFYEPFWQLLRSYGLYAALAAIPYVVFVDMRMREPRDGFWHLGRLILGQSEGLDRRILASHGSGWIIKAYFLPLMFVYLTREIGAIGDALAANPWTSFMALYALGFHLSFVVDLVFAVAGYILTFRLLDSHIRTVEPTVLGWLVALVCYQPFWSLLFNQYLYYENDLYWAGWLDGLPWLQFVWGCAILAAVGIYAWATVMFGTRFSNLTNRGILTNGPYRFSKHPAYLSKCLSYWLVSIPFIPGQEWDEAVRHCLLLAIINLIYFARARTEERHLSRDPVYRQYAEWINKHGLLSGLGRIMPGLRYSAPATPLPRVAQSDGI
jgi:protein-S-isoprenylcysteine O-methyltransferase Ste14